MSKKYTSRATKMVLASLLAASMALPSLASAEVGGTVTGSGDAIVTSTQVQTKKVIDFTLTPADSMAARFLKGPWEIVSTPGGNFLNPNLSDSVIAALTELTVNGQSAIMERQGKKSVYIPYSEEVSELNIVMKTSYSPDPVEVKVILDQDSVREEVVEKETTEEIATTETEEASVAVSSLPDGIYNIKASMLKEDKSGISGAGRNFSEDAILTVKDGKATVELFVSSNHNMIVDLKSTVNGKLVDGENATYTAAGDVKSIIVPVETLGNAIPAEIRVDYTSVMPTMGITMHPIFLKLDASTIATEGSIYTYKPGTNEGSIMNGTYLESKASYKAVEGGYEVTVTFPKGKYIVDFKVEDEDAQLVEGVTATHPSAVYKFVTSDISDRIPATIHINVNEPAVGVVYDENHHIEFKLTGKAEQPFTDIKGSWATPYISELYKKGIFVANDKFYPTNPTERYQFALMLQRAFNFEVPATTTFKDIQKFNDETIDAVKALSNVGVIKGTNVEQTTFTPNGKISRKDTAIMINRLLKEKGYKAKEDVKLPFTDVKAPTTNSVYDKEAYEAITQLYALNVMSGKTATTFDPNGTLTRAEMARVLSAALEAIQTSIK